MKNFRIFAFIFTVIFSVTSIIGCGKKDLGSDTKQVTVWESYNSEEHEAFVDMVKAYEAKTGVKVTVQRVPFGGMKEKITTAAISGDTPDICRVATTEVPFFAIGGLGQPINDFQNTDQLYSKLLPIAYEANKVEIDGKEQVYAIADQLTCVALFYNKDMFKKAGISTPPKTLDELMTIGKKLTNRAKGQYAIGLNNSLWWNLPWLYVHGAKIMSDDNNECYIDSAEAQATFEFMKKMVDPENGIEGGAWRAGGIDPDQGFVNQKYAMVLSGQWNLKTYQDVNYGVTLIPGTSKIKSATNIGGTSMMILEQSKNKIAAYKFLDFLTSEEAQKIWVAKTGQNSVNKTVNDAADAKSAIAVFNEQLKYSKGVPKVPNYGALEGSVNPFTYAILDGKMDVKDALAQSKKFVIKKVIAEIQKGKKEEK